MQKTKNPQGRPREYDKPVRFSIILSEQTADRLTKQVEKFGLSRSKYIAFLINREG